MRLAEDLGMSLQRTMQEHTSSEFVLWKVRRERRANDFHREDTFWATIAQLIATIIDGFANKEDRKHPKLEQFMHRFVRKKHKDDDEVEEDLENLYSDEFDPDEHSSDADYEEEMEDAPTADEIEKQCQMDMAYWFALTGYVRPADQKLKTEKPPSKFERDHMQKKAVGKNESNLAGESGGSGDGRSNPVSANDEHG